MWWTPLPSPTSLIRKTTVRSFGPIKPPVPRSCNALKAILRSISVTGYSSTLAILWPMKTMPCGLCAGLGILDAIRALHARLAQDQGLDLAVRIGIHSGLVVVGEIGGGTRQERQRWGRRPILPHGCKAWPRQGGWCSANRRSGWWGDVRLRRCHHAHAEGPGRRRTGLLGARASAAESRFEAATTTGLTPLVGRDGEIDRLLRRWSRPGRARDR